MKFNFKYTIINVLLCLFVFWIVIKYLKITLQTENFNNRSIGYPKNALINYKDLNSPLYSHNVNLPINDPISCNNFCGPNAQCLITREQCTSDIDCKGCMRTHPVGYYNNNFSQIYPGSKNSQIKRPYEGIDLWEKSFNKGLELYNKKQEIKDKYSNSINIFNSSNYKVKYPMTISATGLFYETTPSALNATITQ
jgi:hypothetical protein